MEGTFSNGVVQPVAPASDGGPSLAFRRATGSSNILAVLDLPTVQQWLAERDMVVVPRELLDQYAKDTKCDADWSDPTCPVFTRRG